MAEDSRGACVPLDWMEESQREISTCENLERLLKMRKPYDIMPNFCNAFRPWNNRDCTDMLTKVLPIQLEKEEMQ